MKKKHGWVFEIKGKPGIFSIGYGIRFTDGIETIPTSKRLKRAIVVRSRKLARSVKDEGEVLRKVELYSNGKAKKIVPGR